MDTTDMKPWTRLLAEVGADFENGEDMASHNPFVLEVILANQAEVVKVASAICQTAVRDTPGDERESLVLAGFLQGLVIGYEVCARRSRTSAIDDRPSFPAAIFFDEDDERRFDEDDEDDDE